MLIENGMGGVFVKKAIVFGSKLMYVLFMFILGSFLAQPRRIDVMYVELIATFKMMLGYIQDFIGFCENNLINVL